MKITGHKTLSVYQRYRTVAETDNAQNKERRIIPIAEAKETSR